MPLGSDTIGQSHGASTSRATVSNAATDNDCDQYDIGMFIGSSPNDSTKKYFSHLLGSPQKRINFLLIRNDTLSFS